MLLIIGYVFLASSAIADDSRYCGTPVRDSGGYIVRSTNELNKFKKIHPCPSTGLKTGACPGWQINHTIPLACGGCDVVNNMDWMPTDMKTCAGSHCRDRYERKIYAHDPPFQGTDNCKNEVIK